MHWTDSGFILGVKAHGESGAVIHLLTRDHGRHAGLVRGGAGRRLRGVLQPGNEVTAAWRGRLEEHLGSYTVELTRARAAPLLDDALRLAALTSACALSEVALPERELHPAVYAEFAALMDALEHDIAWPRAYLRWEMRLLADLGFGLDLAACAATGTVDNLIYVSPNTGRAVSGEAGAPWRDRMLALPSFLRPGADPQAPVPLREIGAALALTAHFLDLHVLALHGLKMPPARHRLADRIARSATTSGAI